MKRAPAKRAASAKRGAMGQKVKTVPARIPGPPVATGVSGVSGAKAGFMDSAEGGKLTTTWASYSIPFGTGYDPWSGSFYSWAASRERREASAVAYEMAGSNPTIATLTEVILTQMAGVGLTCSSKVDARATGLTEAQARTLSNELEALYRSWSRDPGECDSTSRNTIDEIAFAFVRNWMLHGEGLAAVNWARTNTWGTKVGLLDVRQIATDYNMPGPYGLAREGVVFSGNKRVGFYIRPVQLGALVQSAVPVYVPASTFWGRLNVIHIFELQDAGQVRGVSALKPALTSAQERRRLAEYTLQAAVVQAQWVATVTSTPIKGADRFAGLKTEDDIDPAPNATDIGEWAKARDTFYGNSKIEAGMGRIAHLLPNDKFEVIKSETPNSTYQPYNDSLTRDAARAAGESFEATSGNFEKTSFSASRMAFGIPHRTMLRRRRIVLERFYSEIYKAFVEEAIERGFVQLPRNARPFREAAAGYARAEWRGMGMIQPDPKKAAEADVLELENGLATYEQKLAERGLDLEETIAARKREKELLDAAGLQGFVGMLTTQVRTNVEPDDDEPPRNRRPIDDD